MLKRQQKIFGFIMALHLALLTTCTCAAIAQSNSVVEMQVQNAIQDQRLGVVELGVKRSEDQLNSMSLQVEALRSSMDRLTGMGIGLGVALTILQAFQVILAFRRTKS